MRCFFSLPLWVPFSYLSYSVYLFHEAVFENIVFKFDYMQFPIHVSRDEKCMWGVTGLLWRYLYAIAIGGVLICNGLAAVCYCFIEKPGMDARRVF